MCKKEYTYLVQLKTGVTVDEFTSAVLPRLDDRTEWVRDLQDWEGHPKFADFRFAVAPSVSSPFVRIVGTKEPEGEMAQITVTFGEGSESKFAAFVDGYSARIFDAVTASGGIGLSH